MMKNKRLLLAILAGALLISGGAPGKEKSCTEECKEETAICVKMCTQGVKKQGSGGGEAAAAIAKCKEACQEAEKDCLNDCAGGR